MNKLMMMQQEDGRRDEEEGEGEDRKPTPIEARIAQVISLKLIKKNLLKLLL